ncbi:TIGR00730 family Rossman fold protein [Candidatus Roizmanbacteria bacterium CG09_land_8_20_14_0_10_41_9]|uniref:Cytokinin riboside 5'-monophosphate phosphoribohydrolase n=1 Tax=Candidatus Roizmanbacteria bacterium CG09_land_8_20_14_0_10_41_9 TaxID=1974850 RepID=A0A2H0WVK5_9BACT|nr:MAG: TIGR00730 family Rossman fold protein [Candidatus Roizmanbacteria bacterium CG09_land_8_20_14_0_10_41_9]
MKTICIFCAVNEVGEPYVSVTKQFAKLLVKHGYDLVWGGSNRGLMKVMADEVQASGGKIIGITMEPIKATRRMNADEMIIAKDLTERKRLLLKRSDAIVLLVGGLGSLDEVTEILERKKRDEHGKPIVILNTNDFYQGVRLQLERMKKEGFIIKELSDLIYFASTPEDAIRYIDGSLKSSS